MHNIISTINTMHTNRHCRETAKAFTDSELSMSLRQFDLNLLQVFAALVTEAHVTRAAEKVFLSQSATSHALNRLRQQLDDPILVRCGNGLQATPRALAMLPEVQDILQRLENTLTLPERFDPASSNRVFTLAVTDYFEAVVLPGMMPALQQAAPGIVIDLEMIGPHASLDRLDGGAVDLVIGLDDSVRVPSHLLRQHWMSEQLVCLVGNRFEQIPDHLSLGQYLQLPHVVMLDQTDTSTNGIDRWLAAQQLQRQRVAQMINYLAAARLVSQRMALLTLPRQMAQLFSQWLPVRIVAGPEDLPSWNMTLVQHPLRVRDNGLQWLIQQLLSDTNV
jgi:DNA-binding transcriptional LysR family regulator